MSDVPFAAVSGDASALRGYLEVRLRGPSISTHPNSRAGTPSAHLKNKFASEMARLA